MVVNKSNTIGIALLLALALTPVATVANGGNNLVQLDLKKASNNSVNVTLFTSNGYNDNVMVRKKSDNKYVILIPKVQSSGYSASSLNGVRDLVSNVDVKTVNDTSGGYTKVTLITTKPLDIKTSAQKSAPITAEQKEYKTLIAQANAVKNNIGKQEPQQHKVQKTEVTVNKAPVQPQKTQVQNKKAETKSATAPKQEVNPKAQVTKDRQVRREQLSNWINEVKQEKQAQNVDAQVPKTDISSNVPTAPITAAEPVKDISEMTQPKANKGSVLHKIKNKVSNGVHKAVKPLKYSILAILGLIILSKLFRGVKNTAQAVQSSFVEQLEQNRMEAENTGANSLADEEGISWQERYQRYLDKSAKPVRRANNQGNYAFIKTPAEPVRKLNKKRQDLERMVQDVAAAKFPDIEPEIVESEDSAISKTIKFKAFDRHASLDMSSRDKIKSRFKKYENELPLHEQRNIELGKSALHANKRRLKDANLDVADVDKTPRIKYKPQEYIMSSADELFSIIDKENAERQAKLDMAKAELAKNNVVQVQAEEVKRPARQTNPIAQTRKETKDSYLNGLIVKSGYNIDQNKGFYIVNLDGKSALIGKVNDEVFVLKKFDKNVTNPIQVRHDNANVYMVKAGDFKSLVEVNSDKMGVLIEL